MDGHRGLHHSPWYDGTRPVVKVGGVRRAASRQAWIERHGDPGDRAVLHTCSGGSGDKGCINVRHLRLGDDAENTRDRDDAGHTVVPMLRGEEHGNAKLTVDQVREIRRRYAPGANRHSTGNRAALAEEFGVAPSTIRDVVQRRRWKHVD